MIDRRRVAIYRALFRLDSDQLMRIIRAEHMVCDRVAFDASTGFY